MMMRPQFPLAHLFLSREGIIQQKILLPSCTSNNQAGEKAKGQEFSSQDQLSRERSRDKQDTMQRGSSKVTVQEQFLKPTLLTPRKSKAFFKMGKLNKFNYSRGKNTDIINYGAHS